MVTKQWRLNISPQFLTALAAQVKAARLAAQLTQRQAADKLGQPSHYSMISQYETGRRVPSVLTLYRLAQVYGVTTDYFLRGQDG